MHEDQTTKTASSFETIDASPARPIPAHLDGLDKAVADLRERVSILADRLEPVVVYRDTDGEDEADGPAPMRSLVAGRLVNAIEGIEAVSERVSALTRSIEV